MLVGYCDITDTFRYIYFYVSYDPLVVRQHTTRAALLYKEFLVVSIVHVAPIQCSY